MKRLLTLFMLAALMLSLTACGSGNSPDYSDSETNGTSDVLPIETAPDTKTQESSVSEVESCNHLDDFQQYGFTFVDLRDDMEIQMWERLVGKLVSDATTIYLSYYDFHYDVPLSEGNIKDYLSITTKPLDFSDRVKHYNNVGYDVSYTDGLMEMLTFVAKRFYENPTAPFADLVPDEIAKAAEENHIFIGISYSNVWNLWFLSLDHGYVADTYSDGSQDIQVGMIHFCTDTADETELSYCDITGVNNTTSQELFWTIKDGGSGCSFDPDTLQWHFTPEVTSLLLDIIPMLNSAPVK